MQHLIKLVSVVSFGVFAAAACSSSGNGQDAGPGDSSGNDAKKGVDTGSDVAADVGVTCNASSTYSGTLTNEMAGYTPTPADAGADAGPQDFYQLEGALNADPDLFDVEIYDGYGVFTNGITAGTYTLSGDELNYATCGLCVLIQANATQSSADPYMATGGTITITSISPTGTLAGSGSSLTFTHVTIDQNSSQSTPVGDGCNSSIATVSFSSMVTTQ